MIGWIIIPLYALRCATSTLCPAEFELSWEDLGQEDVLLPNVVVLPEFVEDEAWFIRQPLHRDAAKTQKQIQRDGGTSHALSN